MARTEASPKLLPDTPISLPKLRAADVKLRYRGEHILGRSVPLDDLVVNLSIIGGMQISRIRDRNSITEDRDCSEVVADW